MFAFVRRSMIARLLGVGFVGLLTSGSQVSCNSDAGAADPRSPLEPHVPRDLDSGDGPTFQTTLVLRDSAGTETYRFARGELITFELTVRNRTAQSVTVTLGSTLTSMCLAFEAGENEPAWHSAAGLALPAVLTSLPFGPYETKVISHTWHQEMADGRFLPRGHFEARCGLAAVGVLQQPLAAHELASNLRAFTVR
jgi:hypothetical protein